MADTQDCTIFQTRVKELMKKERYSQRQLCELCGITEAAFSHYMTSNRIPKTEVLANIANILHTTMDYLIGAENNYGFEQIKALLSQKNDYLSKVQKQELSDILLGVSERLEE